MTQLQANPANGALLDNPVWSSLSTVQEHFAEGDALARRYPTDISPFGALLENSEAAFKALQGIAGNDTVVLQLLDRPKVPRPWEITLEIDCLQMICDMSRRPAASSRSLESKSIRPLTSNDVPEMLALTKLTEPGPFRARTIEMGTYLGMHDLVDGQEKLIAMAGERMRMTGFTEVSAVCTHPEFRGRGYGNLLVSEVVAGIAARGETAILHVKAENAPAVRMYERLGFSVRLHMFLAAIVCAK